MPKAKQSMYQQCFKLGFKLSSKYSLTLFLCFLSLSVTNAFAADKVSINHAISMHGDVKYPSNFSHFEYTNPKAPKGGTLRLGGFGSFDSLNSFIPKGAPPDGIGLIYDTMLSASHDEPFTMYGLVAKTIELPQSRDWVIFNLRPEAKFHDDHPIRAEDIVFTFNLLMEKGSPAYASYYANIEKVEALSPYRVKYTFKDNTNQELPLIVGQLPVLPKHFWSKHDFAQSGLIDPLGSGPYTIKSYSLGRQIVYQRDNNYWAKNLPVNKGLYNFDIIRYDYYKDMTAMLEAFKAGAFDFNYEYSSKLWATGYQGKSLDKGWLKKEEVDHKNSAGMQAFVMNLRNPLFQDIRVRKALNLAFNFEWTNEELFYGAYGRTDSFFENSELAASKEAPTGNELKILQQFKDLLPVEVFGKGVSQPVSSGDGYNRKNLLKAKALLEEAGWKVENNILVNQKTKQAFQFEIMLAQAGFERIVNPYVQALKKLGIIAKVRLVDISQYIDRIRNFQFEMVVNTFSQSQTPGNEQFNFWHSSSADQASSNNYAGIKNPAIDGIVEQLVKAKTRQDLVDYSRALDRVLLHNHYVIPQWHSRAHRIAYWNKFSRPKVSPIYDANYGTGIHTWWIDEAKQKNLKKADEQTSRQRRSNNQ